MATNDLPFKPAIGTDSQIHAQDPAKGYVWFATDSKKIYYSDGEAFLSMGGNSNIYYGIMDLIDTPDENQKEFQFTVFDIEGNDEVTDGNYIIPNKDDLILNMGKSKPDGCFYRVKDIEGSGDATIIYTTKLTLAGGGTIGPSGPSANSGTVDFTRITPGTVNCLYKQDFNLAFQIDAYDSDNERTGNGTYTVTINSKPNVISGTVYNGKVTNINIGPYLNSGDNTVRVFYTVDIGGSSLFTESRSWQIKATQVELKWDYDLAKMNSTNSVFELVWEVSGVGITKTTHITIDDTWDLPLISQKSNDFSYVINNLMDYGLTHGVHKFTMWASFKVNPDDEDELETPKITKNIIFYTPGNDIPIISCNFFNDTVVQYNTVEIPIIFYKYGNTGTLTATIKENGVEVDTWEQIENGKPRIWYYTPLESTTRNLTIQCGSSEKTLVLEVEALDINNDEVPGYAFRFKASDFPSNTAIQNWNSNGVTATFSDNFDWINGGLKSERDENDNVRQYFRIKAGSTMTINYKLFNTDAPIDGKSFKFIFRADSCRDYDALVLDCYDDNTNIGLRAQAQSALIKGSENEISIPYCEDSYIELGFNITPTDKVKRYLTAWMDGVPTVFIQYSNTETFKNSKNIVIGSNDCDVCVYMIKVYEKHLKDNQHLENFIADAPNAQEMLDRYNRNDILDEERDNVISPIRLAEKNPNCRVHVYDIPKMVSEIDVPVPNCSYTQYHGSKDPILFADNVSIKIQGTSSASYGLSAFNIDSEFNNGFTYADGSTSEKWSMNPNSIPVNYFTTKVNVASAEHANNALNQDWYNKFQPYKTLWREKQANARDCMEFTPGVLFFVDHNTSKDLSNSDNFITNNVFAEISGYTQDPYARMYSICNMGNSKKNTEVFHDQSNPLEYCVEVGDNQKPTQWMTSNIYDDTQWSVEKPDFEFRYPKVKKLENESTSFISPLTQQPVSHRQHAFDSWRRFINWMAESNPQPKYKKFTINSQEEFNNAFIKVEKDKDGQEVTILLDAYIAPENENGQLIGTHTLIDGYDETIHTYYRMTDNLYGYTMEPLLVPIEERTFSNFEFSHERYSKHLLGSVVTQYANKQGESYTHDTYEYRMAKMLKECEDYLVMDSVLFHYLFIERHAMIDNVAKNTFWSTEDGYHWNLTKNYDNDTADGNDNQGKLTLTYGIEPFDHLPGEEDNFYFNANQAVWFRFSGGLYEACRTLYRALGSAEEGTDDSDAAVGTKESAWDSKSYLKRFSDWQKTIPERCWIEDYYRKYVRPLEIYGDHMYVDMLEGGQKTHQRKQFETYQDYYMSSKYASNTRNRITIRGNGEVYKNKSIPVTMYADCYIQAAFGSGNVPNVSMRVKRNETVEIKVPDGLGTLDNATIYWFLPQMYQTIGELGRGNLSILKPAQLTMSPAVKLRTLIAGEYGNSTEVNELEEVGFANNVMLEEVHMTDYPMAKLSLDLTNSVNLKVIDLRNSGFSSLDVADGAPTTSIRLCRPVTLTLSNLRYLNTLTFQHPEELNKIIINNIDDSVINSKTNILDVCSQLKSYTLKNVQWEIKNSSEITNNKINILDRILTDMIPYTPQGQRDPETSETSLTGKLIVKSDAYNSDQSLAIYNYYAVDVVRTDKDDQGNILREYRRFPKLDIQFEGSNAKLHTITILKDNDNVLWTRKLRPGDNVDETFLSNGPNGAFNINDIFKSPTEYNEYKFNGAWEIYDSDTKDYIGLISNQNKLPLHQNITQNLTFVPVFEETTRYWSVTFKQENDILETVKNIAAGTFLRTVVEQYYPAVPWKDDSKLADDITYSFEGYALSKSATGVLNLDNYPVTSNMELYAIFKEKSVYNNIHYDYWNYDYIDSNAYTMTSFGDPNTAFHLEKGIAISPKPGRELKGKITIPAEYNGYPIYKIQNEAFKGDISITHVFFEGGSKLRVIGERAFENSHIKYFQFTDSLRYISQYAFSQAERLQPDKTNSYLFGENLFIIANHAFSQALNFNGNSVIFYLPSSLQHMGFYALSNFASPMAGSEIIIGSPQDLSNLDLSKIVGATSANNYRVINDSRKEGYYEVTFYSKIYDDAANSVFLPDYEVSYTVGQILGNDSKGIKSVTVKKGG